MRQQIERALFAVAVAACAAAVVSGCNGGDNRVTIPAGDNSDPTLTMSVLGLDDVYTFDGSSMMDVDVEIEPEDSISVLASARDDNGGVKRVEIAYQAEMSCQSGSISYGPYPFHDYSRVNADEGLDVGDQAFKLKVVTLDITTIRSDMDIWLNNLGMSNIGCNPMTVTGEIQATAENFHGGTTISPYFRLTARHTP